MFNNNGNFSILPSEGYDAIANINVEVDVASPVTNTKKVEVYNTTMVAISLDSSTEVEAGSDYYLELSGYNYGDPIYIIVMDGTNSMTLYTNPMTIENVQDDIYIFVYNKPVLNVVLTDNTTASNLYLTNTELVLGEPYSTFISNFDSNTQTVSITTYAQNAEYDISSDFDTSDGSLSLANVTGDIIIEVADI